MQGSESTVTHAVAIQSDGRDTPASPQQRGRLTYLTQCQASESGMFTPFASTSCDVRHRNPVTVIGRISRINMSQERASMRARALFSPARRKALHGQSGRAEARAWRQSWRRALRRDRLLCQHGSFLCLAGRTRRVKRSMSCATQCNAIQSAGVTLRITSSAPFRMARPSTTGRASMVSTLSGQRCGRVVEGPPSPCSSSSFGGRRLLAGCPEYSNGLGRCDGRERNSNPEFQVPSSPDERAGGSCLSCPSHRLVRI